ncbi:MAG TPA: hypothetical protein VIC33_02740 [Vicinamibacterales bacterium]|jgi:hypothetical protein
MNTSIDPARLRPSRLWKRLPEPSRVKAALAFWNEEDLEAEQMQAVTAIAQQRKFRAKSVMSLPVETRARYLATLPTISEPLAARALVAYHLDAQRPMMSAFLDDLGIAHDQGAIADEEIKPPDQEKLAAAASKLAKTFAASDVAIYLSTLLCQDPGTWAGLAELPELT